MNVMAREEFSVFVNYIVFDLKLCMCIILIMIKIKNIIGYQCIHKSNVLIGG